MQAHQIKDIIEADLQKQNISARALLSNMRVVEETSRKTFAYMDNKYAPFYYHLGKYIQPKSLIKIGFRLGLLAGSFLKSCKSVERFLGFQEKDEGHYSSRIGIANIKDLLSSKNISIYHGQLLDESFLKMIHCTKWDLAIVNNESNYDKMRLYLDLLWDNINEGGLIVIDYLKSNKKISEIYKDFCKIHNRDQVIINTRYGVGLINR